MINKRTISRTAGVLAFAALALSMMSCVEERELHYEGVRSFKIVVRPLDNNYGSTASPLKFSYKFGSSNFEIGAVAMDANGVEVKDYNGVVNVKVVPGETSIAQLQFTNGRVGTWTTGPDGNLNFVNGTGADVSTRYNYGSTRIWIEDSLKHYTINGVAYTNNPSMSTAVSDEFVFENLTIEMIQRNPDYPAGPSPLMYEYADLKGFEGHDLVVTNINSTGFYVADLGSESYNSLFVYTYSQPLRLEIGDRICELQGGIAEFTGMTQLQYPSYGVQGKVRSTAEDQDPPPEDGDDGVPACYDKSGNIRPCTDEELESMQELVDCSGNYAAGKLSGAAKAAFAYVEPPEPRIIDAAMLSKGNRDKLEALEGSVITIEGVRLSTDFIDCDDNGNGKIESGSAEADCRTACNNNSQCTELSSLRSYDQWRGWTLEGNAEISVASTSIIAGFSITDGCTEGYEISAEGVRRQTFKCEERVFKRITGNLKQTIPTCGAAEFCDAANESIVMLIVEPRYTTDLVK